MKKTQLDFSTMSHSELLEVIENVTSQLKKFTFYNGKMQKLNIERKSPNKNDRIIIENEKGKSTFEIIEYVSVLPPKDVVGEGKGNLINQQETEVFVQLGREL